MKHFTFSELTRSATAQSRHIDNQPDPTSAARLEEFVTALLDPLREEWERICLCQGLGTPALNVTSGYRSPQLNRAVGGSPTSAHCLGLAVDLVPANGELSRFKSFCRTWLADRDFDQLISENEDSEGSPRWIHLGFRNRAGEQRRQMLSMIRGRYLPMR